MPRYRVTYESQTGCRFVAEVDYAPTPEAAETAAAAILTQHLLATVGRVTRWAHAVTERSDGN